jgi:methylenetetrahydrofolate dehydrogenase (NADP+)/methenyltetrahydrofolate cyclohydrolase
VRDDHRRQGDRGSVDNRVAADDAGLATTPVLATVLLGEDPASAICVRNKRKRGVEAGTHDMHRHLSGDVAQETAAAVIDQLASDPDVTRILVQLPLPPHLNAAALIDRP